MAFFGSTLLIFGFLCGVFSLPATRLSKDSDEECDRCLPGWGLVTLCDGDMPSVCKPCPSGTWTPHHPHLQGCRACSRCGKGLYVESACNSAADTKCGWCSSEKGHFNVDFIKKCLMRHDVPKTEESAALRLFFEEEKKLVMAQPSDRGINVHHRLWRSEEDGEEIHRQVVLKPTFHQYNLDKMDEAHRRKVFTLVGLTGVILLTTIIFAGCFLYHYFCKRNAWRSRGFKVDNQKLYVQLTEEQNKMIRESAARLDKQNRVRLESTVSEQSQEEEFWEDDPLRITENPFEKLLHTEEKLEVHSVGKSTCFSS